MKFLKSSTYNIYLHNTKSEKKSSYLDNIIYENNKKKSLFFA